MLQGPGENAGVVDIGYGWVAVFKMESHNHPSFIEPYQGSMTGVGGILRDIFTMGARPIACMDALRFGEIDAPRMRFLIDGVVRGIGDYGNCVGIPTVGGETGFHRCYNGNILVNAFALGIARRDRVFHARASGAGNPILYVGSRTGRDGIHGATMASESFDKESEQKRPTVQVGDPFTEKILLEACLEAMRTGAIVAIQDMGAAGLTSSTFEMAGRGGVGIRLDLDRVPLREPGLTPYEMMLSESQERMVLVAKKGREEELEKVFRRWGLEVANIGEVTSTGRALLVWHGETAADIPIRPLTEEAPVYRRPVEEPADLARRWEAPEVPQPEDLRGTLESLLATPEFSSKGWIWQQYDHTVRTNTVQGPGGDAAVLLLKGTPAGLAMTCDVNPVYCYYDPRRGGSQAVAEAVRNLACVGADPVGLTDCLNFGNPERPEVSWQFREAVRGMSDACRALGVPVISGNVSFYNETEGKLDLPDPGRGHGGRHSQPRGSALPLVRARRGPRRAAGRGPLRIRRRRLPQAPPWHRAGPAARRGPGRRAAAREAAARADRPRPRPHGARPLRGGPADRPRRGLLRPQAPGRPRRGAPPRGGPLLGDPGPGARGLPVRLAGARPPDRRGGWGARA